MSASAREAYESDSDSGSEASSGRLTPDSRRGGGPSRQNGVKEVERNIKAVRQGLNDADSDSEDEDSEEEEDVDWDKVIGRLRASVTSRSRNRREEFVQSYLKVTDNGKLSLSTIST